jgi:hypothetical protein
MTHRSPLVTLAGLVVAFAIMFGVNLAMERDQPPTAGVPSAPAYPSPAATIQAPSQTQGASASTSPTISATQR